MEINIILKFSSFLFLINILIIVSIICPFVLPMPLEETSTENEGFLALLSKQFDFLRASSQGFINLQNAKDFNIIKEVTERTTKPIFDRLLDLFTLPFEHLAIQEINTGSERNRGDCQAPDSSFIKKQGSNLCTVCEDEMAAVTDLIHFFKESRNASELFDMAEACRDYLNEYLLNYALTYILETKFPGIQYPSLIEVFPGMFIKKGKLNTIKEEITKKLRIKRQAEPLTVYVTPVFYTTYPDEELSLNYFREDSAFNSHHWNWHIIHRVDGATDRRGELFWYMHHQMLARYDLERLSMGLDRVKSSGPLNQIIDVGFFPNLDPTTNGDEWAGREANTLPQNKYINMSKIEEWHAHLSQAAKDGFMKDENDQKVPLSDDVNITSGERRGIDIFAGAADGDWFISPNTEIYGSLHNLGHNILAQMHDPDYQDEIGTIGVMGNAAVSARDPVFYLWHKYIDEVIQEYKTTQIPYSHQQLELTKIHLYDVQIAVDVNIPSYERQSSSLVEVSQETISTPQNVSQETMSTPQDASQETMSTPQDVSQETISTPQNVSQETIYTPQNVSNETIYDPQNELHETTYSADVNVSSLDIELDGTYRNPETIDGEILSGAEKFTIQPEILTGCNTYGIDISRGLDFGNYRSSVIIEITHLDHVPFLYSISVLNARPVSKKVMVRIFLAPKYGTYEQAMPLQEQQHLFILLDTFGYVLTPGQNVINRLSTESSLTSKCRNSTRDSTERSYSYRGVFGGGHCGCGWPQHLLLPRGSQRGMMFQLFVLLTDWDHDYVPSENVVSQLCGVRGDKYPDWQPMGYPFDRPFNQSIKYVDQLAKSLINAHVSDVSIRFTGRNIITKEFTC